MSLAIEMNLDFAFNTGPAIKNAAKLRGGINLLTEVSEAFSKKIEFLNKGSSTNFTDILHNVINTSNVMKELGALANQTLNGIYGNELIKSLNDIYNSQKNVAQGMRNISEETAIWGATQAVTESFNRSSNAAKLFDEIFKKVSLSVVGGSSNIISQLTELHSTNEKAFDKLNKVMQKANELSDSLNPRQAMQYRQNMSQLSEAFSTGAIDAEKFIKSQDRLNYRFEVMNVKLPQLKQQVAGLFSGILGQMTRTLGVLMVVDDAVSSQQQTVETVHRLALRNTQIFTEQSKAANSFSGTVFTMNSAIRDIGRQTQISMTKASEVMNSLAEARVPGTIEDLKELSITSVRMSQAFGISEGQAADLFKTLSLAGGLSSKGINEVGEALADVQAVWGLTGAEATEAAAQVGHVINRMSRMGAASIKNAKIVAKEVGRMTTAFTRAGLSANEASQMMDRFMDPSKIEENAYLWHTMGLTVSQSLAMMSGDASSMEGMTEKMMKSAVNLKKEYGNNPLALAAMAEAMGMTVQMVNQLSNEYEREANMTADMRKELEKQATLESQAAQARQSAAQALQRLGAIGNVLMQSFVMPMLDAAMLIISPLIKFTELIGKVTASIEKLGPVGKGIIATLRFMLGAFMLFTLLSGINALKLMGPLNGLGGAFTGLLGKIKNLAIHGVKAIGAFVAKSAKALLGSGPLGKAIEGIGDKMSKIGTGNQKQTGVTKEIQPKQNKFMEGMAKLPAKNLMMVGAAIMMIAGAIFLLSLSLKTLTEVVQTATAGEILVALGIMAGLILILGLAVFAASKLFATAAPGLLIFGGTMLMVAGAVALMVLSLSVLMNTIKDMNPENIALGLAVLAVALSGLIVMAAVLAPAAITGGVGLLFLGGAMLMIGGAVALMALSLSVLMNTIKDMNPKNIALGLAVLAVALSGLIVMAAVLAPAAIVGGTGLLFLGGAMLMIGGAVALMVLSLSVLMNTIKDMNPENIALGLAVLGTALLGLAGIAIILGSAGFIAGPGLLFLGGAMLMIGGAVALMVLSLSVLMNTIKDMNPENIALGLAVLGTALLGLIGIAIIMAAAVPLAGAGLLAFGAALLIIGGTVGLIIGGFLLLGSAMKNTANNFMNMGLGAKLFAENIGVVLTGIDQLKQKLSGVSGMSNTFVEEIGKMTTALAELKNFAGNSMIGGIITMLMKPVKASSDKDSSGDSAIINKMDDVISHLNNISSHTHRTAEAVESINKKLNSNNAFSAQPIVGLA